MSTLTELRTAANQMLRLGDSLVSKLTEYAQLSSDINSLKETAHRKQAELNETKGFSGRNLMLRLTRKLDETLEREEMEARNAASAYQLVSDQMNALSEHICSLRAKLANDAIGPYYDALTTLLTLPKNAQNTKAEYDHILQAWECFYQIKPAADTLSNALERARSVSIEGDRITTATGQTLNCTNSTLHKQLSVCQQALDHLRTLIEQYNQSLPKSTLDPTLLDSCADSFLNAEHSSLASESRIIICIKWLKQVVQKVDETELILAQTADIARKQLYELLFSIDTNLN